MYVDIKANLRNPTISLLDKLIKIKYVSKIKCDHILSQKVVVLGKTAKLIKYS